MVLKRYHPDDHELIGLSGFISPTDNSRKLFSHWQTITMPHRIRMTDFGKHSHIVITKGTKSCARLLFDSAIDHIGPSLKHRSSLIRVFRFVVDRADPTFFMGKAFLYPVRVESRFEQERARGATYVMNGEWFKFIAPTQLAQIFDALDSARQLARPL